MTESKTKSKEIRLRLGSGYEQNDPGWYLYDEVSGKVWMTALDEGADPINISDEEIAYLRKILKGAEAAE